tara:strand:+ start:865 stop:1143 length:279 start_codon:yes stop_codon:yes gene_type:complete
MGWKEFTKGVDFDFKWGMKFVRKSLILLLMIKVVLITYFILTIGDWNDVFRAIINIRRTFVDYMALLAGIIIFIAIPFLTGIKVGLSKKKKK